MVMPNNFDLLMTIYFRCNRGVQPMVPRSCYATRGHVCKLYIHCKIAQ